MSPSATNARHSDNKNKNVYYVAVLQAALLVLPIRLSRLVNLETKSVKDQNWCNRSPEHK